MFILSLPLVLISLIDVPFQIWSLNQKLRMTKQEVKDEFKNSEGDPHLKSKLRKMQNALRSQQMIKDIPTADVIITNPEHFAVAIKYDDTSMSTPVVVAKGLDNVAGLIKQVATANTIPIVEAPVVARTLYYNVEIGHPIPEQLYTAVARVLTYIYELNLYKRGKVNRPKLNNDFKIPPQMER
jgi:flagellar biosynthetic protein FlhB